MYVVTVQTHIHYRAKTKQLQKGKILQVCRLIFSARYITKTSDSYHATEIKRNILLELLLSFIYITNRLVWLWKNFTSYVIHSKLYFILHYYHICLTLKVQKSLQIESFENGTFHQTFDQSTPIVNSLLPNPQ